MVTRRSADTHSVHFILHGFVASRSRQSRSVIAVPAPTSSSPALTESRTARMNGHYGTRSPINGHLELEEQPASACSAATGSNVGGDDNHGVGCRASLSDVSWAMAATSPSSNGLHLATTSASESQSLPPPPPPSRSRSSDDANGGGVDDDDDDDDDADDRHLGNGGASSCGVAASSSAEQLLLDDGAGRALLLGRMSALRRSGRFCDVLLRVGERKELAAHRAVLAAASSYFDAALSGEPDCLPEVDAIAPGNAIASQQQRRQRGAATTVLALDDVDLDAFELLLDYAYTGRLCLRPSLVKSVYQGAAKLGMRQALDACGQRLQEELTVANCLDTLLLASRCDDRRLMQHTEQFIQVHFCSVKLRTEFMMLPRVQVKIYGAEFEQLASSDSRHVCQLVADWLAATFESHGIGEDGAGVDLGLDQLCSHEHLLYLTADNRLHDCASIDEDSELGRSDSVIDYKKIARKQQYIWNLKEGASGGITSAIFKGTCRVIASDQDPLNGYSYVCLVAVNNCRLMVASLHFSETALSPCAAAAAPTASLLVTPAEHAATSPCCLSPGSSSSSGDECGSGGSSSGGGSGGAVRRRSGNRSGAGRAVLRPSSFRPLATMSASRCGVGLALLSEGVLAAVGGHDRGECLNTVEAYDCEANIWRALPSMNTPRGRFECEQIKGRLYACGGSDGRRELDSAEYLDLPSGRWVLLPDPMAARKSNAGVGVVHDRLYVVGGWSGQSAERSCETYDPAVGAWQFVAPLNIGRSQAAVCSYGDNLYAFGGQDSWTCFNTAEVYDIRANKWQLLSPMPCCRRGAGAVVYKGKIYLVGGSDGSVALRSTHVYDPTTDSWSEGPPLITKRVNAGVAVGGGQLYAVGGFSGKEFLNTIERLDADDGSEWCSYARASPQSADESIDK